MASIKLPFKIEFPSRVRSNNGCWTCRLRRKKCDEKRPNCGGCRALEITCYFEDDKPDWMDSGRRQREMAESIKSQVKKQASQRRDRKYIEMLEAGTKRVSLGDDDDDDDDAMESIQDSAERDVSRSNDGSQRVAASRNAPSTSVSCASCASDTDTHGQQSTCSPPESSNTSASPAEAPWHNQNFGREAEPNLGGFGADIHFIMIYLDYVFPYLFPFYQPPVLNGGRGWLLDVLHSSKSMYHNAVSFASYYFNVLLSQGKQEHNGCLQETEKKLHIQLELGLKELQKEMCQINKSGLDVRKGIITLQSILQMLIFDLATGNRGNWKLHLDAAIALFQQLLPNPAAWTETLDGLRSPDWPPIAMTFKMPWSTPQASLRFFTANLLYFDVMSSIAFEHPPRLHDYQESIVPGCVPGCATESREVGTNIPLTLYLDEFLGLKNTVLQLVSGISSLAAWKKTHVQAGTLSLSELVSRGTVIVESINSAIMYLEADMPKEPMAASDPFPRIVQQPLPSTLQSDVQEAEDNAVVATHNHIWLHACLPFVYIVISGWQPSNPEIRRSVIRTKELLLSLPKPAYLSGVVWPFFIAGCLSPSEDEDTFRGIAQSLGVMQAFGSMRQSMEAMEAVWARRDQADESWDVAKCLNVLGYGILPV